MVSRSLSLSRVRGPGPIPRGSVKYSGLVPVRETYISSRISGILGGIPGGIGVGFVLRY